MEIKVETWGSGDSFYQQSTLPRPSLIYQFLLIKVKGKMVYRVVGNNASLERIRGKKYFWYMLEVNLLSNPVCRLILKGLCSSISIPYYYSFQKASKFCFR
jgi:hypothetical protein